MAGQIACSRIDCKYSTLIAKVSSEKNICFEPDLFHKYLTLTIGAYSSSSGKRVPRVPLCSKCTDTLSGGCTAACRIGVKTRFPNPVCTSSGWTLHPPSPHLHCAVMKHPVGVLVTQLISVALQFAKPEVQDAIPHTD